MTRFMMEMSGNLGDFWKRNALEEVAKMQMKVDAGDVAVDENGAAYWKSKGSYLMDDTAEILSYTSFKFDVEATKVARDKQVDEQIAEYRKSRRNYTYSAEELYEMRAAFGPGTTVVDVLTGETVAVL